MSWLEQLKESLLQSLSEMGSKLGGFAPKLVGTLVILLVGYIISRVAQKVATAVLGKIGFDKLCQKVGLTSAMEKANMNLSAAGIVGKLIFWFFMLTFMMSATEQLGLQSLAEMLQSFVAFLPNVLAAAFVVFVGMLFANFVRDLVQKAGESVGFTYGNALGNIAFGILMIVIASIGIGQLEIETDLINSILQIFLVATAVAMALALGLGTRDLAKQIVAGVYARDMMKPGAKLRVGEDEGKLVQIGSVSSVLETTGGEIAFIPNSHLTESIVHGSEEILKTDHAE